ncbi:MAG: helix-turn-helix transcriptional regulator [Sarcina sp.]
MNNNNFYGKINGKNTTFFMNKLKKKTYTKEEKQELVKEVLSTVKIHDKEFYDEYFEYIFDQDTPYGIKLILTKNDSLYSYSNVCYVLELLGTIWLSSVKKKDDKAKYLKTYDSEELFQRALWEEKVISQVAHSSGGSSEAQNGNDDFAMLVIPTNYKLEKKWDKIENAELKEYAKKYDVLSELYNDYKSLTEIIFNILFDENENKNELTFEEEKYLNKLKKYKQESKKEILHYANNNMGIIRFKQPLKESGYPSWDEYDEKNPKHVRAALQLSQRNDLQTDIACIVLDLNNTINQCEFTSMQEEVLYYWRLDKTQSEIAEILEISQPTVNQHLNVVVNKIVDKNWEIYTDWYYLNICRGEYKYCKECKEVHLVYCFNRNKRLKDGYETICKKCYNSKQKR